MEKTLDEQNDISRRINMVTDIINPGILINTSKICPLLGKQCIGDDCLGYKYNFGIKVVSWEESIELIEKNLEDGYDKNHWIEELKEEDWELYSEVNISRLNGLDETHYIFTLKPKSKTFGRCISLGRIQC